MLADDVAERGVAARVEIGRVAQQEVERAVRRERAAAVGDVLPERARLGRITVEARGDLLEEPAERVLAVGRAERREAPAERKRTHAGDLAVVGERERAPPELAREGVDVGERDGAVRLLPDVRDSDLRGDRVRVEESDELAVRRGVGLPEAAHRAALVEAEAPAVSVGAGATAAPREPAKRKDDVGRDVAVHSEQLAHARGG